jgi:hypothetical protein
LVVAVLVDQRASTVLTVQALHSMVLQLSPVEGVLRAFRGLLAGVEHLAMAFRLAAAEPYIPAVI